MQNEFETAAIYSFFAVKFIRKSKNFLPGHRVKLKEEEEEKKKTFTNYWMTLSYEELCR